MIGAAGATVGIGGVNLTSTRVEFEQPVAVTVPVTVYVEFAVGFAVTTDPVVALNPADGVHVYVLAPEAVNVVGAHWLLLVTEIAGTLFTTRVTSFEVAAGVHAPETTARYL